MLELRDVREDEYDLLEPFVIELSRYHGLDEAPDAAGLRALLWGDRALGRAFFAVGDAGPVGYAILSEYGRFQYGKRALELVHFHVSEGRRGQGLGARFMALLEDWASAQGHDRIVLTAGTERAESFYQKVGYEKIDPATRYRKLFG